MTTTMTTDALATTVTAIAEAVGAALPAPLEPGFATQTDGDARFASSQLDPTARAVRMQLVGPADVSITIAVSTRLAETAALSADSLGAALEPAFAAAAGQLDPTIFGALSLAGIDEVSVEVPTDAWAVPLEDATGVAAVVVLAVEAAPAEAAAPAPAMTHEFAPLPAPALGSAVAQSLDMLHDVEMAVTVELGRTRMTVREILALTPGTVVELDRAAGAPVDVVVNGTLIARGEVVVIDEEFGIRVTEIVSGPEDKRFR
jgi:flagellar motor switch protein FliN/FliY